MSGPITRTGGREATEGLIEGDVALAVGMPTAAAPAGWRWRKLTDLSRLETGHTPSRSKPEYWDGDIPWIGIRDATGNHGRTLPDTMQHVTQAGIDNSSARILPTNTVCLSRTASVGYVVVMGREMATSQDFVNWVCDEEKLDYRFLKYVLLAEQRSFSRFSHGTTHQTIYFPEVKAFHICAPEINEQRAIADVLSSLDDKIEQNRLTGRKLEELARAVFKAWFVDFEPVKAKAAGATAFPGMPPETFAALPTRLSDSPLGPVPEGWRVTKLKAVTTKIGSGATPRGGSAVYVHNGPAFIRSQNVYDHEFKWEGLARLSDTSAAELDSVQVMRGDVLINITGDSILRTCVVDPAVLPARVSQHVAILRAANGLPPRYLHLHMVHPRTKATLLGMNAGGTRQAVTKGNLESLAFPVPPSTVLEAFERLTASMFNLVDAGRAESRKLATLRDYLLPRLLSGRVRVGTR